LARVQKLSGLTPDNLESALALARAAIDAREFAIARRAMQPWLAQPSQRVALLMADLEQAESSDEGRSREWTARAVYAGRDPAWTADGFVSERWLPFSPVTGRIDAFEWKAPTAEIGHGPAAAEEQPERPMIEVSGETARSEREPDPRSAVEARVPQPGVAPKPARKSAAKATPLVESVVPITHVPDDPGPDPYQEPEALPEQTSGGPSWKRLFQ
jgi:HemY protein